MKCFVCHWMANENRVRPGRLATMTVTGHSVCDRHAFVAMMWGDRPASMLEQARSELRMWWAKAETERGEWLGDRFSDGSTLAEADYPWSLEPDDSRSPEADHG